VWGFLKYYHSGVAAGSLHWDSALVATVPRVKAARTQAEFRSAVQSLLDGAGPARACASPSSTGGPCRAPAHDSLRKNLDLRWLDDTTLLGSAMTRELARVRDNPHSGTGRYVRFQGTAMFDVDTAFNAPQNQYPEEGQRLLALFRFWNAARYYFPYMYVNGGDWNAVLPEFIPRMIAARDAAEYHLAVNELTARINDAHVSAGSRTLSETFGMRTTAFEARFVEGKLVVWKPAPDTTILGLPQPGALQRGDVITHINSVPVASRWQELTKYVAAGNDPVRNRKLVSLALRGKGDSATYTIERNGQTLVRTVAMARVLMAAPAPVSYPVGQLAKVLPNTNIGYINLGDLTVAQVDSAMTIVKSTEGLVLDVRNYPRGTMYALAMYLNPAQRTFVTFKSVDPNYPGQLVMTTPYTVGRGDGNPSAYRGRVAILVDERTQSHAEFTAMALQTSPQNKVIGSQTAGADGNVTYISLPGGIRTLFTGLGVYYPDGRPTQRLGIVPDIVVRPTVAGVRAGKDEVLERALEYIRSGR
jgi:C-terminal processing protease CtpA/Prc